MNVPDVITCHRYEWPAATTVHWRPPDTIGSLFTSANDPYAQPYARPFRTCSFCGSIHPSDALSFLKRNAPPVHLHSADWKYGWPHKFYVNGIPNLLAGRTVIMGRTFGPNTKDRSLGDPILGTAPNDVHAKLYSDHLQELPDDKFVELAQYITAQTGITFFISEAGLCYTSARGSSHDNAA
jgi:hypothetical protein